MEEQQRRPAYVDLADLSEAIARGAMRALEAHRLESLKLASGNQPALFSNPIIRWGGILELRGGEVPSVATLGEKTATQ